jgi:hypothetical protein
MEAKYFPRLSKSDVPNRVVSHPTRNLFLLHFLSCRPACLSSEWIWNYGSHKQSVGLLGWVISPVARPLPAQESINTKEMWTTTPRVGFEPKIPVFERAKTFRALNHAANHKKKSSKTSKKLEGMPAYLRIRPVDPLKCDADEWKSIFINRAISLDIQ